MNLHTELIIRTVRIHLIKYQSVSQCLLSVPFSGLVSMLWKYIQKLFVNVWEYNEKIQKITNRKQKQLNKSLHIKQGPILCLPIQYIQVHEILCMHKDIHMYHSWLTTFDIQLIHQMYTRRLCHIISHWGCLHFTKVSNLHLVNYCKHFTETISYLNSRSTHLHVLPIKYTIK